MRIIPARAGFTPRRLPLWHSLWDHPRSRGVYLPMKVADVARAGSSPLARGLLLCIELPGTTSRDHPRSRGVYAEGGLLRDTIEGSSPLARGLLTAGVPVDDAKRIIPARAGFTVSALVASREAADHPRSRGVYCVRSEYFRVRQGSSPLARGLPNCGVVDVTVDGIIPARAGFTLVDVVSCIPYSDHPRSRGVYPESI